MFSADIDFKIECLVCGLTHESNKPKKHSTIN